MSKYRSIRHSTFFGEWVVFIGDTKISHILALKTVGQWLKANACYRGD